MHYVMYIAVLYSSVMESARKKNPSDYPLLVVEKGGDLKGG